MTGITEVRPGLMTLNRPTLINRFVDAPTRPWRNGKGRTTSLHTHAPSNGDDAAWTLSLASLDSSADFSTFPGYDRHFMIAGSSTVDLDIDGNRRPVAYTEVARFTGEAAVRVETGNGPSRALNLMVRRDGYRGDLTFRRIDDERVIDPRRVSALVLLSGVLNVGGVTLITCGDTVVIGDKPVIVAGNSAVVARIRVQRNETESGPL